MSEEKIHRRLTDYLNSKESSYWEEGFTYTTEFLQGLLADNYHDGDCCNVPASCSLCILMGILEEFEEYCQEKGIVRHGKKKAL